MVPQQSTSKRKQGKGRDAAKGKKRVSEGQPTRGSRFRVTILSVFLLIVTLCLILVLMVSVQMSRLRAESKARSEAWAAKVEPISKTTTRIESASWDVRLSGSSSRNRSPDSLSVLVGKNDDGWGRPLRIEYEGTPPSEYTISSAGSDGEYGTNDDVSIRFDAAHEQLERINTFGLPEMEAKMEALRSVMDGGVQGE